MATRPTKEQLDQRDPDVAVWLAECGLARHPVSLRLIGTSADDVSVQLQRLNRIFGEKFRGTQARQSGRGVEWIAYGTILE